jgi:RimJ/RimL family protein N-acetyltransferase
MLKLAMKKAFAFPQIARLELNVYTFNTPAIKAYTRVGFKHEGTRRSSTLVGEERWDTAVMAILRDEYNQLLH